MAKDQTEQHGRQWPPAGEQVERPDGLSDIFRTAEPVPASKASEAAGFTQMFEALSDRKEGVEKDRGRKEQAASTDRNEAAQHSHPVEDDRPLQDAAPAGGGDFTRMFQTLRGDAGAAAASPDAPSTRPGGGFTQLLRTLSGEDNAIHPMPEPTFTPEPLTNPAGEWGQLTRVVSRSGLREARGRMIPGMLEPRQDPFPEPSVPKQHTQTSLPRTMHPTHAEMPQPEPETSRASDSYESRKPLRKLADVSNSQDSPQVVPQAPVTERVPDTVDASRMPWLRLVPLLLLSNVFVLLLVLVTLVLLLLQHRNA